MKVYDVSDFLDDDFDPDSMDFSENKSRIQGNQSQKSKPTGGSWSSQHKILEESNFYIRENKRIRKKPRINDKSSF